jgi:hypothetical protein
MTELKVISYSLFGDSPVFTIGAIKNAIIAKQWMPDWECRFYVKDVPLWCLQALSLLGCKLIEIDNDFPGTTARFLAFEDADIVICRDIDDRLSYRGIIAVNEWLESGLDFHIIKDHPSEHYTLMLAGMWGGKGKALRNIRELLTEYYSKPRIIERNSDQEFLDEMVYYPIAIYNTLYHSEFYNQRILGDSKAVYFSTDTNFEFNHIGMALDENDCFIYGKHQKYRSDFPV